MACALTRPDWIKSRYNSEDVMEMHRLMSKLSLNTICTEALCPNMGECCKNRTATFLILGNVCTRNCGFCAVRKGKGARLDSEEPQKVAEAARTLRLKHVVITSVTRDDLPDGGAAHFAATIRSIKATSPASTVEALIPDMRGLKENLDMVVAAGPDVVNHNIETVPSLYANVRPEADYGRSLRVLRYVKERAPQILSKTGVMVGLGETPDEIYRVMDDLIAVACDILTIGQYLRPSEDHIEVKEYVRPEIFAEYKKIGEEKGFGYIVGAPLVRSSYNALAALETIRRHGRTDVAQE